MTNLEEDGMALSEMEVDVIGEVMNISMGAAATALSTVLDTKVNITTPRIENVPIEDFEFSYLEPVIGVVIKYVEGIEGSNVLLLKDVDLKEILCHLLSMEMSDEFEFDEISRSAVCEIMNQMMGSAASALASFLGKPINISPPEVLDLVNTKDVRGLFALKGDYVSSIKFNLSIEGLVESEFISAMEPSLVREIVQMTLGTNSVTEDEIEVSRDSQPAPPPIPAPVCSQPQASQTPQQAQQYEQPRQYEQPQQYEQPRQQQQYEQQPQYQQPPQQYQQQQYQQQYQQPMMQPMYEQQQPTYQQPMMNQQQPYIQPIYTSAPSAPKQQVSAAPYNYRSLGDGDNGDNGDNNNLDLIMSVPIQLTVELGRTKRKIKDIVDLYQGNIIELDRQAGDQVDIMANGRLIAKGDVVVVDDNYSVRITEIIKSKDVVV